jgi:hypothetical protein
MGSISTPSPDSEYSFEVVVFEVANAFDLATERHV